MIARGYEAQQASVGFTYECTGTGFTYECIWQIARIKPDINLF